jgi:hypothetical protein
MASLRPVFPYRFAVAAALVAACTASATAERPKNVRPRDSGQTVIATDATSGWLIKGPAAKKFRLAVVTAQNAIWANPLAGSSWIAKKEVDGVDNVRGGFYTYQYTFCPALASGTPYISLSVLADNAFDVFLNGNSFDPTPYIGYSSGSSPFQVPQAVSTSSFFSQSSRNVLQFSVENGKNSPTGLDVAGYVSGVQASC